MRISQLYGLQGTQGTFEFIDVDIDSDTALFIDPAALAQLNSKWGASCTYSIQSYFQEVIDQIKSGNRTRALHLLGHLSEENATHLGYSSNSRGSGVGSGLAEKFYRELSSSKAVKTGLVKDLEDAALLIEGVREDRISDVTTNIIRRQLVKFTQRTCKYYGIPMSKGVALGPYWDARAKSWKQETFKIPVTPTGPLLLVPKSVVRKSLFYNPGEYYRHYVLEYYKEKELASLGSPFVYAIKSGEKRVRKGEMEVEVRRVNDDSVPGVEKRVNVSATEEKPRLLSDYKRAKSKTPAYPRPHSEIAEVTATDVPDYDELLADVVTLNPGRIDADAYERAVEKLLSSLFYPHLVNPRRQEEIHEGRKRIDIGYTNAAEGSNFFYWVGAHHPAATVVAECKNYSRPLANPEYDQISGRFSPSRGKVGLLVYRNFENKNKILSSCRDTARDDRGFILALDDDDLSVLVAEAKSPAGCASIGGLLYERFSALMS